MTDKQTRFLNLEICCICYKNLTEEEISASNQWGYVCTADRNKCIICHEQLSDEEVEVSKEADFFLCNKHWCECMPQHTPWSYVVICPSCYEKTFCKSCKAYGKKWPYL